jgi:hypothetical protein
VQDVARFKYPPYWVKLEQLWESMLPIDAVTGASRGFLVLQAEAIVRESDRCPLGAVLPGEQGRASHAGRARGRHGGHSHG